MLFDARQFTPLDPTQEPIFPAALKVSSSENTSYFIIDHPLMHSPPPSLPSVASSSQASGDSWAEGAVVPPHVAAAAAGSEGAVSPPQPEGEATV